jgi:hypothetical protein
MIKNYGLNTSEAQKFRKEVEAGGDAFKLLDPFKKRAGIFDVASAVASSNAIKDIRKNIIENIRQQGLYTAEIDKSTSASVKLLENTEKQKKVKVKKVKFDFEDSLIQGAILPSSLNLTSEFMQLNIVPDDAAAKARAKLKEIELVFKEFGENISSLISGSISEAFAGIGAAIGGALANGGNILASIGASLLDSLGGLLVQMGRMAIEVGVGLLAIKVSLKSLNPFVAIAAGVGLVALGSIFSSKSKSIGGSIGGGGGGGASSSTGSGANNQSFSSGGFSGGSNSGGTVVFEIAGQKLVGVLSNTLNANRRLGGQLAL